MTEKTVRILSDKLFRVLRGFYSGGAGEIAGELTQNAARAGATRQVVTLEAAGKDEERLLTVENNGRAPVEPLSFVQPFMSGWGSEVDEEQQPMGLGFFSLLYADGVGFVRVLSHHHGWALDVDCKALREGEDFFSVHKIPVNKDLLPFRAIVRGNAEFLSLLAEELLCDGDSLRGTMAGITPKVGPGFDLLQIRYHDDRERNEQYILRFLSVLGMTPGPDAALRREMMQMLGEEAYPAVSKKFKAKLEAAIFFGKKKADPYLSKAIAFLVEGEQGWLQARVEQFAAGFPLGEEHGVTRSQVFRKVVWERSYAWGRAVIVEGEAYRARFFWHGQEIDLQGSLAHWISKAAPPGHRVCILVERGGSPFLPSSPVRKGLIFNSSTTKGLERILLDIAGDSRSLLESFPEAEYLVALHELATNKSVSGESAETFKRAVTTFPIPVRAGTRGLQWVRGRSEDPWVWAEVPIAWPGRHGGSSVEPKGDLLEALESCSGLLQPLELQLEFMSPAAQVRKAVPAGEGEVLVLDAGGKHPIRYAAADIWKGFDLIGKAEKKIGFFPMELLDPGQKSAPSTTEFLDGDEPNVHAYMKMQTAFVSRSLLTPECPLFAQMPEDEDSLRIARELGLQDWPQYRLLEKRVEIALLKQEQKAENARKKKELKALKEK